MKLSRAALLPRQSTQLHSTTNMPGLDLWAVYCISYMCVTVLVPSGFRYLDGVVPCCFGGGGGTHSETYPPEEELVTVVRGAKLPGPAPCSLLVSSRAAHRGLSASHTVSLSDGCKTFPPSLSDGCCVSPPSTSCLPEGGLNSKAGRGSSCRERPGTDPVVLVVNSSPDTMTRSAQTS